MLEANLWQATSQFTITLNANNNDLMLSFGVWSNRIIILGVHNIMHKMNLVVETLSQLTLVS
jgi:hypothetical protein